MNIPSHASAGRPTSPHLTPTKENWAPGRGATALIGAVLAAMALLFASSASAAVTCSHTAGGEATIALGDLTSQVSLVRSGSAILVKQGSVASGSNVACAPDPITTTNVSSIAIDDLGANQSSLVNLSLAGGPFEPGVGLEAGSAEIEIAVDAGAGSDTVTLTGEPDPADDNFRLGTLDVTTSGINLNAPEVAAPDGDDISFVGVEQLNVRTEVDQFDPGPDGDNTVDASGGPEFTGPFPIYVNLHGGNGDDTLTAPPAGSLLAGNGGDDLLTGSSGMDTVRPANGTDTADGKGGTDTLSYFSAGGGVTVDLRVTAPQDTRAGGIDTIAGFENLSGDSGGNDVLIGTGAANVINGGEAMAVPTGDDVLMGLGGADELSGSNGSDTVSYATGSTGPVTLDLGLTTPQATGGAGTDYLPNADIENVIGSEFGDTLTGTAGPNLMTGGPGTDTIAALAGPDSVIVGGDAVADAADCGADTDAALADKGIDALTGCEAVTLLDVPAPPPPPADTTAPETRFGKVTKSGRRVTLRFSSSEPGSSFECKLDGGPFRPCKSPRTYRNLGARKHSFRVRATDGAGNRDGSAAVRKVRVQRAA